MMPSQRISVVEKLSKVGAYYPQEILSLLRRLRLEPAGNETTDGIWKPRTYSQVNVVLTLAGVLHQVARGILTNEQRVYVMEELFALAIEEERASPSLKYGLPNDGKRADGIIRNLLENGPGYVHEFGDVAAEVVLRQLDSSSLMQVSVAEMKAIRAIIKPLCGVVRHQTWSDGATINMGAQCLYPSHPNMEGRALVLQRVRRILEDGNGLGDEMKSSLWEVLSDAHSAANYARGHFGQEDKHYLAALSASLFDDLAWVKRMLLAGGMSLRELRASRRYWDWHLKHGTEACHRAAKELEEIYLANPIVECPASIRFPHLTTIRITQRSFA